MVDEMLLGEIFGAFGVLTSCRIVRDPVNGNVGYCDFADYQSARYVMARCIHISKVLYILYNDKSLITPRHIFS